MCCASLSNQIPRPGQAAHGKTELSAWVEAPSLGSLAGKEGTGGVAKEHPCLAGGGKCRARKAGSPNVLLLCRMALGTVSSLSSAALPAPLPPPKGNRGMLWVKSGGVWGDIRISALTVPSVVLGVSFIAASNHLCPLIVLCLRLIQLITF